MRCQRSTGIGLQAPLDFGLRVIAGVASAAAGAASAAPLINLRLVVIITSYDDCPIEH